MMAGAELEAAPTMQAEVEVAEVVVEAARVCAPPARAKVASTFRANLIPCSGVVVQTAARRAKAAAWSTRRCPCAPPARAKVASTFRANLIPCSGVVVQTAARRAKAAAWSTRRCPCAPPARAKVASTFRANLIPCSGVVVQTAARRAKAAAWSPCRCPQPMLCLAEVLCSSSSSSSMCSSSTSGRGSSMCSSSRRRRRRSSSSSSSSTSTSTSGSLRISKPTPQQFQPPSLSHAQRAGGRGASIRGASPCARGNMHWKKACHLCAGSCTVQGQHQKCGQCNGLGGRDTWNKPAHSTSMHYKHNCQHCAGKGYIRQGPPIGQLHPHPGGHHGAHEMQRRQHRQPCMHRQPCRHKQP